MWKLGFNNAKTPSPHKKKKQVKGASAPQKQAQGGKLQLKERSDKKSKNNL